MKSIITRLLNDYTSISSSLEQTNIFINQPWVLIEDGIKIQKLIFRTDKSLIISQNGTVKEGTWDYIPEAQALLLDRVDDKILCNQAFVDKGVMLLKVDDTSNDYFVFANQNVIPDLDVSKYLESLQMKLIDTGTQGNSVDLKDTSSVVENTSDHSLDDGTHDFTLIILILLVVSIWFIPTVKFCLN